MTKVCWILSVFLTVFSGKLLAQIASFNFSNNTASVSGWTNVHGDPSILVRTATAGGVTVSSISTANWSANGSSCAVDGNGNTTAGGFFLPAVMINHWAQNNGPGYNLALYNSAVPQLQLSGLNKDSTYIIRMSGSSRYNSGSTQYTVSGTTVFGTQLLDCWDNYAQGVTFLHVQPDVNGIIKVYINGNASDQYPMISGLQIYPGSAGVGAPAVAITTPLNGARLGEGSNVVIKATAVEVGATISKVEFYADTVKIGQVNNAPYNFTWNSPDPGNYVITVKATDSAGTINTATANIAIESLNYFWSTTGNIATGGDSSFVGTVDTNRLAFRTNNIERMSILGDGSVGIGIKNTYGYKLAVNGNAIFTKIRIKTAGTWPDYVFKKGYVLPNLNQLEEYISLHRHLPGITPEGEVSRDGFDISEQQTALLKKVEELTLYLIDENKQLKAQNKENGEQNKRITEQNARLEQQQREIDELRRLIKGK